MSDTVWDNACVYCMCVCVCVRLPVCTHLYIHLCIVCSTLVRSVLVFVYSVYGGGLDVIKTCTYNRVCVCMYVCILYVLCVYVFW